MKTYNINVADMVIFTEEANSELEAISKFWEKHHQALKDAGVSQNEISIRKVEVEVIPGC
jgi:hypothetical protein